MTEQQTATIAGVFDRAAETYDQVGVDVFGPIADRLVREVEPRPGERALDIGCGRGAVLLRIAAAVGPEGAAHGLDLSPKMVAGALAAAAEAGAEVQAWVGDAQSPAVPSTPYDLITSSLVLFFLPDPLAALTSWRALLAAGGRIGVTTFGPYGDHWSAVDAVFEPYLPPAMRDARTTGRTGPFGSDEGVAGLLRDAGFSGMRTEHATVPVRFRDEDHWHTWSWSVGQRMMWERIPEGERATVRDQAFAALQNCRDAAGVLGFDQVVRFTLAHN